MVKLYQVTLGAAATQVSATTVVARQVIVQNNAAHNCRIGDSTVSSSKGITLASGSPGGSLAFGEFSSYNVDLAELYIAGTAADVIDVLVVS